MSAGSRTLKITILGSADGATKAMSETAAGAAKLDLAIGGIGDGFKKAGAGVSAFSSILVGAGIGVALKALEGVGAVFSTLTGSIGDAQESAAVAAQLAAVLKSTGGAAGLTAANIDDLAESLSNLTGIDDEAIVSAQSVLLTFTNIGKEVFPDTTQAVLDLSVALGQDFKSSAIQVGKALNDPIAGISALTRVGVTFTQAQEDQIKAMVAAGDVAGAQRVILAELRKEFGGSAEAQATNAKRLAVAWGNIREEIGGKLLPIMEQVAGKLNTLLRSDATQRWLDRLGVGITAVWQLLERAWPPLQRFVQGLISGGRAVLDAAQAFLAGRTNLGQFIGGIEILVGTTLGNLGQLGAKVGPILQAFGGKILDFLGSMLPQIAGQLQVWGQRFGAWVLDVAIPALAAALPAFLAAYGDWAERTGRPFVIATMKKFGLALGDWVLDDAIPWLRETLPKWWAAFDNYMDTTARPFVISSMKDFAQDFSAWVEDHAIPWLRLNLPKWLAALGNWLTTTALPAIGELMKDVARAFGRWIADDAVPYLKTQLPIWLAALGTWITETAVPALFQGAKDLGAAMVDGIIAGLQAAWHRLTEELSRLASGLPGPVRDALGMQSPSRVFAERVGVPIVQGIARGIRDEQPYLDRLLGGLVGAPGVPGAAGATARGVAAAAGGGGGGGAFGTVTITISLPNVRDIGDRGDLDGLGAYLERTFEDIRRGRRVKRAVEA